MKSPIAWCFLCLLAAAQAAEVRPVAAANAATENARNGRERFEAAIVWVQTAGEWRALSYQGWQLARLRLEALLPIPGTRPPAVIVDIDETVLDNSPYHARALVSPPEKIPPWSEWIDRAEAPPMPGALEFLRYANSKSVEIFYVTNRTVREKPPTLVNLRKFGFPQVDDTHVLERTAEASKENRRRGIAARFDILLLCGDNLNDFAEFNAKPLADRNAMVDALQPEFGTRFIVFPNPVNGDWEGALYVGRTATSEAERERLRHEQLRPYN
jgi:5'-nucleotidase (lipoprotein e(P4) family)